MEESLQVDPRRQGNWQGLTLAGLLILGLAWAFVVAWTPIGDPDAWYHLAAGREIVCARAVPAQDTWTCTAAGAHWITHEWLYEIVLYLVHLAGGLRGVVALRVLLVGTVFGFVFAATRTLKVPLWLSIGGIALASLVAADRFVERPQVVSLACMACAIWLAESATVSHMEKPRRRIWIFVTPHSILLVRRSPARDIHPHLCRQTAFEKKLSEA